MHPLDQVLGNVSSGVRTRRQVQNEVEFRAFLSQIEATSVEQALEIATGSLPCRKNSTNLKGVKSGN